MYHICKRLILLAIMFCVMAASAQAAGYTGWWWDDDKPGTGYSIEVQCDKAYLVWYLYEESGLNTWYSAILDIDGSTMAGDLYKYEGWPLEPGYDGSDTVATDNLGTVTVNFTNENEGTITYSPAGEGSDVVRNMYRRIQEGTSDSRNLDGWWWDVNQKGIGWFFEAKNSILSVGWYNYRAQATRAGGDPRFYVTWEEFTPEDGTYTAPLLDYMNGQTLTGEWQDPITTTSPGDLIINIPTGTETASMDFTFGGNSYHLTRFDIPGKTCGTTEGCAPEVEYYDPSTAPSDYAPLIRARFETSCGSDIDLDSFELKIDGVSKEPTNITGEGDTVEISYQVPGSEAFSPSTTHTAWVAASDVYGNQGTFEWTFYVRGLY